MTFNRTRYITFMTPAYCQSRLMRCIPVLVCSTGAAYIGSYLTVVAYFVYIPFFGH